MPAQDALGPAVDARSFGSDFKPDGKSRLTGILSRARVSPDGRYGAATTFITGHSYLDNGYSTLTELIDMQSGKRIVDLEKFKVTRDGEPFKAIDFNFWGVTFARDSNRFYATLGTAGKTYLLEGDLQARRAAGAARGRGVPLPLSGQLQDQPSSAWSARGRARCGRWPCFSTWPPYGRRCCPWRRTASTTRDRVAGRRADHVRPRGRRLGRSRGRRRQAAGLHPGRALARGRSLVIPRLHWLNQRL